MVFLLLCVIKGSVLFFTTDPLIITSLTSFIAGSLNIVLSSKDSIIDLKPLAPVFLFIAFLAISATPSSLKVIIDVDPYSFM